MVTAIFSSWEQEPDAYFGRNRLSKWKGRRTGRFCLFSAQIYSDMMQEHGTREITGLNQMDQIFRCGCICGSCVKRDSHYRANKFLIYMACKRGCGNCVMELDICWCTNIRWLHVKGASQPCRGPNNFSNQK